MKLNYKLYQRNEWLNPNSGYKMVYNGEVEAKEQVFETLETLFELFNINHPEDFKGNSMTGSDIIMLESRIFFCDSIGWRELTVEDLIIGNIRKKFEM